MTEPTGNTPIHSFRVPDEVWDAAMNRARSEGMALTTVLVAFLKAYGAGDIESLRQ